MAPKYETLRLLGEKVTIEDGDGGLETVDGEDALLFSPPSFDGRSQSLDSDIANDMLFAGTSKTRSP